MNRTSLRGSLWEFNEIKQESAYLSALRSQVGMEWQQSAPAGGVLHSLTLFRIVGEILFLLVNSLHTLH